MPARLQTVVISVQVSRHRAAMAFEWECCDGDCAGRALAGGLPASFFGGSGSLLAAFEQNIEFLLEQKLVGVVVAVHALVELLEEDGHHCRRSR